VGARVDARTKSFYLLSYCSPARAGKHEVRVEAVVKEGKGEKTGSLVSSFDATGFAPGCDPSTPPSFDVTKGDALAVREAKRDNKKDEKRATKEEKRARQAPKSGASGPVALPPPPPPPPASGAQQDFNP